MKKGLTEGIGCAFILLVFGIFLPILWLLIPFAILGGLVSPYIKKEFKK